MIWVLKGQRVRWWGILGYGLSGKKCSPATVQRNNGNRKHTKLYLLLIQFFRTAVKGSAWEIGQDRDKCPQRRSRCYLIKWNSSVQDQKEKERRGRQSCNIPFRGRVGGDGHTALNKNADLVQEVTQSSTNTLLSTTLHLTCANKDYY